MSGPSELDTAIRTLRAVANYHESLTRIGLKPDLAIPDELFDVCRRVLRLQKVAAALGEVDREAARIEGTGIRIGSDGRVSLDEDDTLSTDSSREPRSTFTSDQIRRKVLQPAREKYELRRSRGLDPSMREAIDDIIPIGDVVEVRDVVNRLASVGFNNTSSSVVSNELARLVRFKKMQRLGRGRYWRPAN